MHYIERGTGDPILFVHGNPAWSYLWRNIIPYVQDKGRAIAVDLIGMGRSEKPKIGYSFKDQAKYFEGFIRELGLRNITLVTHDWGTALGFHYAMRYQDNVKGIAFMEALLKPYAGWDDFPASGNDPNLAQLRQTFQGFRAGDKNGPGWKLIVDENLFIEKLLPNTSLPRKLTEAEMKYYREPFEKPEHRAVIWHWVHQLPIGGEPSSVAELVANYSEDLKASTMPKLLIYAEPGLVLTAEQVKWCDENLKNFQKVSIGPGVHFLQESSPEAVGGALAKWYAQLGKTATVA